MSPQVLRIQFINVYHNKINKVIYYNYKNYLTLNNHILFYLTHIKIIY